MSYALILRLRNDVLQRVMVSQVNAHTQKEVFLKAGKVVETGTSRCLPAARPCRARFPARMEISSGSTIIFLTASDTSIVSEAFGEPKDWGEGTTRGQRSSGHFNLAPIRILRIMYIMLNYGTWSMSLNTM